MRAGLLFIVAVGSIGCHGRVVRPTDPKPFEVTPARLQRGEYLVRRVAACGACHGERHTGTWLDDENVDGPLTGGGMLPEGGITVWIPSLASDPETGLGRWTDDEILRALRDGVRPDGSLLLPMMPFDLYQALSDEDARAIVVYLRSLPPDKAASMRVDTQIPFMASLFLRDIGVAHHAPTHDVAAPPDDPVRKGEYLATAAGCTWCHNRTARGEPKPPTDPLYMAGSDAAFEDAPLGKVWAPNLTPDVETGLGRYAPEQIKQAIRTGIRLDGKTMAPPMTVFRAHNAGMTDADLDAVVAFLKSLHPVKNAVPPRELTPQMQAKLGGP